jgi:hypothetical protein
VSSSDVNLNYTVEHAAARGPIYGDYVKEKALNEDTGSVSLTDYLFQFGGNANVHPVFEAALFGWGSIAKLARVV